MGEALFLTGPPGSGKTTTLRKIVDRLDCRAGGFTTEEIRQGGRRVGFRLVTLDGREAVMAHVGLRGPHRVGRYGVDLEVLEGLGAESLQNAARECDVVVVDEIGPMELKSDGFRRAVDVVLASKSLVLGTVHERPTAFSQALLARAGVRVLQLDPRERERALQQGLQWVRQTGKCGVTQG
jgi:nucleoside-triphosphatase